MAGTINFDALLKEMYIDTDLNASVINAEPILKLFKIDDVGGTVAVIPYTLQGSRASGGGPNAYGQAKAAAAIAGAESVNRAWNVNVGEECSIVQVANVNIALSSKSQEARKSFVTALKHEVDTGIQELGGKVTRRAFGQAGGSMGQGVFNLSAVGGAPTFSLTFSNKYALSGTRSRPGDIIVISVNDGTSVGHTQVGLDAVVVEVGRNTLGFPYLRVAATAAPTTPANPGSWVDGTTYFVFRESDFQPGDNSSMITPLEVYFPLVWTNGISDLHGVVRSTDESLAGQRVLASEVGSNSIYETIEECAARIASNAGTRYAGKYCALVNTFDFSRASKEQQNRNNGQNQVVTGQLGFKTLEVNTGSLGTIELIGLPHKRQGVGHLVPMSDLMMKAVNKELVVQTWATPDTSSTGRARHEVLLSSYAALAPSNPALYGVFPIS